MSFADKVLSFYKNLEITSPLPDGVVVLNPFQGEESFKYCSAFYHKFYDDNEQRTMILGINPGRHGGGVTGIPFTDPIKLSECCDIPNPFKLKPELSADFIYSMIKEYGGPKVFYGNFYFSAVSPLGFTMDGKNLNYYDIKELQVSLKDFIVDSLKKQLSFGVNQSVGYCLGEGENFKYLTKLNSEQKFFETIIPLAHPRFIMQYRRKKVNEYVAEYLKKLGSR